VAELDRVVTVESAAALGLVTRVFELLLIRLSLGCGSGLGACLLAAYGRGRIGVVPKNIYVLSSWLFNELTTVGFVAHETCCCRRVETRQGTAASFAPILDAEGQSDRDAFFVRWAITWNGDLLFDNALFGRGVKHLIRPGALRIVGSRALEKAVRAVAPLFKKKTVLNWEPFFIRALL